MKATSIHLDGFERNRRKILSESEYRGYGAILLLGTQNITYATGIREPSGFLFLSTECGNYLATSLLDYHRMRMQAPHDIDVIVFFRGGEESLDLVEEDYSLIVRGGVKEALKALMEKCAPRKLAADLAASHGQTIDTVRAVARDAGIELVDFTDNILSIRSVKEDWEITLIEKAQQIGEKALSRALDDMFEGITESSLSGTIKKALMDMGSWGEAFSPIVAFKEDTALPHHTPGDKVLVAGSPVLFDLGAVIHGYRSDMTRCLWWGEGGREYRKVMDVVADAVSQAIDAVEPGVKASEPDGVARRILGKHGLAKYFIHGLGHGIGVEVHEKPYLRPGSNDELIPGNVVTIEPGVYIPGEYGVRIEDLVVVTKKGGRVITGVSRILQ